MAKHVPWQAFHGLSCTMKWLPCQNFLRCTSKTKFKFLCLKIAENILGPYGACSPKYPIEKTPFYTFFYEKYSSQMSFRSGIYILIRKYKLNLISRCFYYKCQIFTMAFVLIYIVLEDLFRFKMFMNVKCPEWKGSESKIYFMLPQNFRGEKL